MTVTVLVMTLNFDPLTSKCVGIFLSPINLCMNFESCMFKATQVIMSEKKIMTKFICDLDF